MKCVHCEADAIATQPEGPVCLEHLESPPPTQLDRVEAMLADLLASRHEPADGANE